MDLWEVPFDEEFEIFVAEVRNLLLPIIQTVHKHGLKKRFLHKFTKSVNKFGSGLKSMMFSFMFISVVKYQV